MSHDVHGETRISDTDLVRLKTDMTILRKAAGLDPIFDWEQIWFNLAFAAGGAVACLWALLQPFDLPAQWGSVPLILVVVGYLLWMRFKYRSHSGRSPTKRRDYTSEIVCMVVIGLLALIYRFWTQKLLISTTIMGSAALFIIGIALLIPFLRDLNRFTVLGHAIPLMVCGLIMPFCSISIWVLLGSTFFIGGLATAALTAHYLSGSIDSHASN